MHVFSLLPICYEASRATVFSRDSDTSAIS